MVLLRDTSAAAERCAVMMSDFTDHEEGKAAASMQSFSSQAFYQETAPAARARMLQAQEAPAVVQDFFRYRHPHQRKPEAEDIYLQSFFELIRISRDSHGFTSKSALTQLRRILERFGCLGKYQAMLQESAASAATPGQPGTADCPEEVPAAFYWELRNALRRFLEITDKEAYGSRFMGMIRLKKDEQQDHACAEIWHMLHGLELLTQNIHLQTLLSPARLIRQAILEEYAAHDEDAAARLHHISLIMQATASQKRCF